MIDAIISDVHANLEALERVLADAVRNGANRVFCLGDIVGYGPEPAETIARIREACVMTLAGNHDRAVAGQIGTAHFNAAAREGVERHQAQLGREAILWLRNLTATARLDRAAFAHGDTVDPEAFRYVMTKEDAAAVFDSTDAQVIFVGHTHEPKIHLTGASGEVYELKAQDFILEEGKRYVVNVGAVGYPREANGPHASTYVLYDEETGVVRYRALPFDVGSLLPRKGSFSRIRRFVFGALAVALLGCLAVCFAALSFRLTPAVPVVSSVTTDATPPFLVRTLPISEGMTKAHAGLVLTRGSTMVHLAVVFFGADKREIMAYHETVITSNKKGYPIPFGAVSVVVEIRPTLQGDRVIVKSFDPYLE